MCIAVVKPKGLEIQDEILRTCFISNPDGAGFVVLNDDKSFTMEKGFFTFEAFEQAFAPHTDKQALIHFRIRTHGKVDKDNCHPFQVTENLMFIHNGIISDVKHDNEKSDTIMFNETVLQPLIMKYGEELIYQPEFQFLIGKSIGYSKLAFLDRSGNFTIINKQLGNESSDGIWFSNMSWQKPKELPQPMYPSHPYAWGSADMDDVPWYKRAQAPGITNKAKRRHKLDFLQDTFGTRYEEMDIVRLLWDKNCPEEFCTIPQHAIGEIVDIYSDDTMDVYFYEADKTINVNYYEIDVVKEDEYDKYLSGLV